MISSWKLNLCHENQNVCGGSTHMEEASHYIAKAKRLERSLPHRCV